MGEASLYKPYVGITSPTHEQLAIMLHIMGHCAARYAGSTGRGGMYSACEVALTVMAAWQGERGGRWAEIEEHESH